MNSRNVFECKADIPFINNPLPKYRCHLDNYVYWFKINGYHKIHIISIKDETYFYESYFKMRINT